MFGTKRTKQNVIRTGVLSVNLVSTDMIELMDYFGTHHAKDGKKDGISYDVGRGEIVDVPVLEASRWIYECEVVQSIEIGEFLRRKIYEKDYCGYCGTHYGRCLTYSLPKVRGEHG